MSEIRESASFSELLAKIERREARVAVVGLGYVGLPLALTFSEARLGVVGFDVDASKVDALNAGSSYIKHIPPERVAGALAEGRFEATSDFARLSEVDAIVVAVPTPLTAHREPDMRFVEDTMRTLKRWLRRGQLVVLESTTYPGTTDELVAELLSQGGLRVGEDFYLAFSPEREDPGNPRFNTATIPKVVGGVDAQSGKLAEALYAVCVERVVSVANARTAEAVKLTENIFRSVNIALVNELKVVYDQMGIDVWDVLDAAATKPFGFMKFTPGPGLGGHCIPIDPFYLTWKAREYGLSTRFIELAGEINVSMPRYVVDKLQHALNARGVALKNAKVLVLGIAYKKDVDDPRESPAFVLLDLLRQREAILSYHDPHVPELPATRAWQHLLPMRSQPLTAEALANYDAVLIATDHSSVDYDLVREHARLIVDSRGVYRESFAKLVKA